MSIKLKERRRYFNLANLESNFRNDVKKLSRVGIGPRLKENSESRVRGRNLTEGKQTDHTVG
jgi:hypothetical protein